MSEPQLLTTSEVADLFRVSKVTVARWVRTGKLPSILTPSGYYRMRREDVEELLKQTA